jgi:ATP-dependent exoDNAse (exonuclease V) beta subunit
MKEIGESFFDALEGESLTVDDLANKSRGIASFFQKLRNGVFDPSIENATVANCLGNPEKWCAKTHPQHDYIVALAESMLGDILRFAVEERPKQWKLYKSADLTLKHLNQLRLLNHIETKVHELNAGANRFLLSDTQQLLHSLIGESDSPFIFEKIGTQIEHVMIDEFQDTSTVQWQNFKVLLSEAMSHEDTSNLVVGDVKQSIYRWRSGDWRLLNDIERQFSALQIETRNLGTNYRSERRVIEFNNAFFHHAAELERREEHIKMLIDRGVGNPALPIPEYIKVGIHGRRRHLSCKYNEFTRRMAMHCLMRARGGPPCQESVHHSPSQLTCYIFI